MSIFRALSELNTALPFSVSASVLVFLAAGCGKETQSPKTAPEIEARLAAIRQAGEPVTLFELDSWYVEPPAGENAAPLYGQAFAALSLQDASTKAFREQNQKALEFLHQATARTSCRFPVNLRAGQQALMPHLPKMKSCAQLLSQQARFEAVNGRADLAVQCVLDGLRVVRALDAEPTAISQSVRLTSEQIASAGLEQTLNYAALSLTNLTKLQRAFEETEKAGVGMLARGFAGERCITASMFTAPVEVAANAAAAMRQPRPDGFFARYRRTSTNQADYAYCLDHMTALVGAAQAPFPDCLTIIGPWEGDVGIAKSRGYVIAGLMLPNMAMLLERSAVTSAYLRLAQTALALERYRLAHGGSLPAESSALVPEYLAAIPADPFDGKPLRYKKAQKGYVIYSIGPDRQDDGGTGLRPEMPPEAKYDLVFSVGR